MKKDILFLFETSGSPIKLSCAQICKLLKDKFSKYTNSRIRILSSSISGILNKMVKENELQYSDDKAERGGYIYQLPNKILNNMKKWCIYSSDKKKIDFKFESNCTDEKDGRNNLEAIVSNIILNNTKIAEPCYFFLIQGENILNGKVIVSILITSHNE